jgi:hypothetical protein
MAAHHTWLQPLNCHALVAIYLFYAIGLFPKCLAYCLRPFKGHSQEAFSD